MSKTKSTKLRDLRESDSLADYIAIKKDGLRIFKDLHFVGRYGGPSLREEVARTSYGPNDLTEKSLEIICVDSPRGAEAFMIGANYSNFWPVQYFRKRVEK